MSKTEPSLGEKLAERRQAYRRTRMQSLSTSQIDDYLNLISCPQELRDEIIDRLIALDGRREEK